MNKKLLEQLHLLANCAGDKYITLLMDNGSSLNFSISKIDIDNGVISGFREAGGNFIYVADATKVAGFWINASGIPNEVCKEVTDCVIES